MRHTRFALAAAACAILAACGGNDSGPGGEPPADRFTRQVTFGDSLSDVGTYAVGAVKQQGGGKFTINGDSRATDTALTGQIWVDVLASQFGLPVPCAAQTGLQGSAALGFSVSVQNHANCYNYAQGGARITNPIGPQNAATGSALGALTVPVATQVANHLVKSGGKFSGTEIVLVLAGANDAFVLLDELRAGAAAAAVTAAATGGPAAGAQAAAGHVAANGPAVISRMGVAGSELAAIVNTQIVDKGAAHVVVGNLPDLGTIPALRPLDAATAQVVGKMVDAFNGALKSGLGGGTRILQVDLRSFTRDQVANPARHGLTNTTAPACGANALGASSLVCTANNLAAPNVARYMFSDYAHPTPFEHALIARYVSDQIAAQGWRRAARQGA